MLKYVWKFVCWFLGICYHDWECIEQKTLNYYWDTPGDIIYIYKLLVFRCTKCGKYKCKKYKID